MKGRIAAVLAAIVLLASCGASKANTSSSSSAAPLSARAAARLFLQRYVDPDGRVVRHDQGGDTVSEGQAYAMLLDESVGDRQQFDRVWAWSKANLLQPDGLLAWQWSNGKLLSTQPASDADLDVAKALALAGTRWHDPSDLTQAKTYAAAILANETASAGGKLWLVAGTWARTAPLYVDPSYFDPGTFQLLYKVTHASGWKAVAASSATVLDADTNGGTSLPSDWAQVSDDGQVHASTPPGGGAELYGYDAFRTLIRQDDGCSTGPGAAGEGQLAVTERRLDAKLLPVAAKTAAPDNQGDTYALDGSVSAPGNNPLMLLAAAGAAKAAGKTSAALAYLRTASSDEAQSGSYYLDAWVALGMTLLTTNRLDPCS